MKRNLLVFGIILSVGLITSCGDDDSDAPPPHEVGVWELDSYILTNLPSDYASNEGVILLLDDLSFGGISFESYTLELMTNGTYTRKIEVPGPSINDDGTWLLDDDDLVLDSEDSDTDEEFGVERNEDDQLWLSQDVQFALIKDSVLDTLTQEYVDNITQEEFNALFDNVNLDLVYAFER
ncbi:MAG: hypothetical protein AAGA64_08355 [Bacteroidota bacterium]